MTRYVYLVRAWKGASVTTLSTHGTYEDAETARWEAHRTAPYGTGRVFVVSREVAA